MSKQCTLLRSLYYLEFIFNVAEGLSAIRTGRVRINDVVVKDPQHTVKEWDVIQFAIGERKHVSKFYRDASEQQMTEMLQLSGLVPTLQVLRNAVQRHQTQDLPLYREVDYVASPGGEEVTKEEMDAVVGVIDELIVLFPMETKHPVSQ